MNNRERAERIWTDLSGRAGCGIDSWEPAIRSECLDMIAAQIEEAVKEERRGWKDAAAAVVRLSSQDARAEGYAAAKEQAAGIAEFKSGMTDTRHEIADRIRAMTLTPAAGEGK